MRNFNDNPLITRQLRAGQRPSRPHLFMEKGVWQVSLYVGDETALNVPMWGNYHQASRFAQMLNGRMRQTVATPTASFDGPFVQLMGRAMREPSLTAVTVSRRIGTHMRKGRHIPHVWMKRGKWNASLVPMDTMGHAFKLGSNQCLVELWVNMQNSEIEHRRYQERRAKRRG